MSNKESNQTSLMSARNILKVLSVLCLAFAFCPSFLMSCAGTQKIYVYHAIRRQTFAGSYVTDAHPIMILCYLIPIVIFVVLTIKKITNKRSSRIVLVAAAVDLIMWIVFRSTVKQAAEAYNCKFQTTIWYVFNFISLCLILLISGLVVWGKIALDGYLFTLLSNSNTVTMEQVSEKVNQVSSAVSQIASNATATIGSKIANRECVSGFCPCCGKPISLGKKYNQDEIIGYCSKCGAALSWDNHYCTSCGLEIPENMHVEGERKKKEFEAQKAEEQKRLEEDRRRQEEERRLAEEKKRHEAQTQGTVQQESVANSVQMSGEFIFCPHCGTKQDGDAVFCMTCGKKID